MGKRVTVNLRFPGQYFDQETALHQNYFRDYDSSTGRYVQSDPIGLAGASFSTHAYAENNPLRNADPFGLLVTAVHDTKFQTLTVTDVDTGQSVTASAFTGGHLNADGSIVSPGPGREIFAPIGNYLIVDNPNPRPEHLDWFGLLRRDDRIDDYFTDGEREGSGVRLHLGRLSFGCVTVNRNQSDAAKKWEQIQALLKNTKKEVIEFRKGPHWWNGTGTTTNYGTLRIK